MPRLTQYNYVFGIGTFFALLDAYNNGASKYTSANRLSSLLTLGKTMLPMRGLLRCLHAPSRIARL